MKAPTTATNPNVTITTALPRDSECAVRKVMIGFRPMAMKRASPTMTRTLVTSATPRKRT